MRNEVDGSQPPGMWRGTDPQNLTSSGVATVMTRLDALRGTVVSTVRHWFPEHFIVWHRASGISTIRLGTTAQLMAIGGTALVALWLGLGTANMMSGQSGEVAAKSAEFARMQSQLVAMKSDSSALKGVVADRAAAIEKRQAFLAALLLPNHDLNKLAAMLPRAGDVATASDLLAAPAAAMVEPFRHLESEQFAFVAKATTAAEARLRDTQSLIRRLGLDPDRLMSASAFDAVPAFTGTGGPFIPAHALVDAEPKFKSLFLSWKKLQSLEAALTVIPSFVPVKSYSYSSGFGVRYDPFTGMSAMHAGLDMAGSMGEPIYAAAAGIVTAAGRSGAYGNCVEVAHGKGLATRYGHLSAMLVHPGEAVRQGEVIGRMGSTGRSTGTHLHFEVRIDGRAVNPRPYLDASEYVLAAQHSVSGDTAIGPVASDAL
jgi:murein DD-endopeptidase MepM/ murein hydrolase activator NlpD